MSNPQSFLDGRVILHAGDCQIVLKQLDDNSCDSIVCDPPYHLQSIVKRFGGKNAAPAQFGKDGAFKRASAGFMSKTWDGGDIAFQPELWAEVLRVLKPGGYIMAFSGCRTYHRMACAIEDAGFITHPMFAWCFGSGFPKAHSVSKQIDKAADYQFQSEFRRAAVSVVLAAGMSLPGRSIDDWTKEDHAPGDKWWNEFCAWLPSLSKVDRERINREVIGIGKSGKNALMGGLLGLFDRGEFDITAPATDAAREWDGWFYGTQSLKPSLEPVYFGQKPFSEKTGAANVQKWGTGAINVGACKVGTVVDNRRPKGNGENAFPHSDDSWRNHITEGGSVSARWPANLLLDNSEEVLACFPETTPATSGMRGLQHSGRHGGLSDLGENIKDGTNSIRGLDDEGGSAARFFASFPQDDGRNWDESNNDNPVHIMKNIKSGVYFNDAGSAARFFASFPQDEQSAAKRIFYTSKAGADDRLGSTHPTVKPLDLLQYLVRLITPPGGVCLDLFAGSGTTGEAAYREGFRSILIEREAEYIKDIERRMSLVTEGPVTRAHAGMKARGRPVDNGPLFGGSDEPPQRYVGSDGVARLRKEPLPNWQEQDEPAE